MEIERLFYLTLLFFLLICSGFFSGSEVALFSLEKKKIQNFFPNSSIFNRYLNSLLSAPRRLLISILIGNNIVNVAISLISVILVTEIALDYNLDLNLMVVIQIIIISTFILIFGELLPKMIATKYQIVVLKIITIPLYYFSVIIYPISEIISELIGFVTSKLKFDRRKLAIEPEELSEIKSISKDKLVLNENEKEIIESLSGFKDISVSEVMIPRVDIVALSSKDDVDTAINLIKQSGHSRIPVYEDNIDNIIGVIFAKDLFKFTLNPRLKKGAKLLSLLKKTIFVPETKKISDLLKEFQLLKNHFAIVVDEYGGTAGIITLEDIIEQVLGDIWDEFDKTEYNIIKVSDNSFIIDPHLTFSEFESETNLKFHLNQIDKNESIATFILNYYNGIPPENYSIELSDFKLIILEIAKKRIKKIRLEFFNN